MNKLSRNKFEKLTIEETMDKLNTSENGLNNEEVESLKEKWGPNAIEEHHINPALKFLSYFWGPIPWMIEIAAAGRDMCSYICT